MANLIKIKGTDFAFYTSSLGWLYVTGEVNDTSILGNLKVKDDYLHYKDNNGTERRALGYLTGNSRAAGNIAMATDGFLYGDYSGDERKLPAEPGLIIEHDPNYGDFVGIFNNVWCGNTFITPYAFKLTKIQVRYYNCSGNPCTNGILNVYDTPTANGELPALIATKTITLPALSGSPPGNWVDFDFDEPTLLADHVYLFLSQGCSTYYNEPFHCTTFANHAWPGLTYSMWTWDNLDGGIWSLGTGPIKSIHHKVWGIPV